MRLHACLPFPLVTGRNSCAVDGPDICLLENEASRAEGNVIPHCLLNSPCKSGPFHAAMDGYNICLFGSGPLWTQGNITSRVLFDSLYKFTLISVRQTVPIFVYSKIRLLPNFPYKFIAAAICVCSKTKYCGWRKILFVILSRIPNSETLCCTTPMSLLRVQAANRARSLSAANKLPGASRRCTRSPPTISSTVFFCLPFLCPRTTGGRLSRTRIASKCNDHNDA